MAIATIATTINLTIQHNGHAGNQNSNFETGTNVCLKNSDGARKSPHLYAPNENAMPTTASVKSASIIVFSIIFLTAQSSTPSDAGSGTKGADDSPEPCAVPLWPEKRINEHEQTACERHNRTPHDGLGYLCSFLGFIMLIRFEHTASKG
jgi:hypothetical protein